MSNSCDDLNQCIKSIVDLLSEQNSYSSFLIAILVIIIFIFILFLLHLILQVKQHRISNVYTNLYDGETAPETQP